jgi:hypothetical protein
MNPNGEASTRKRERQRDSMDLTRRFVFRGNASAIAGQLFRPKTIIVDVNCGGSSLGVSGGRSQAQIKGASFGDIIKFGSAFTLAEGLFDDEKQAAAVTDHKGKQSQLSSTTTVTAETREISVGIKPVVTIKRVRGTLVSRSPKIGSGEPSIAPAADTTVQGVSIGGSPLIVDLNVKFFQRYDTRGKVLAAADDPKCFGGYGNHFVSGATVEGQSTGSGLIQRDGAIYATIVKQLRWDGKPPSNARIDGHSVIVKDFGTVYFGELLIGKHERRMTMVRFELGSPIGGYCDFVDVGSNGTGFP